MSFAFHQESRRAGLENDRRAQAAGHRQLSHGVPHRSFRDSFALDRLHFPDGRDVRQSTAN